MLSSTQPKVNNQVAKASGKEDKQYLSKTKEQMDQMQSLVKEKGLVVVNEHKSLNDEAVYSGYMTKDKSNKEGWGTQIWPDGGKYEGEWHNNCANGKGKFWHADGDLYEGHWKNDKANGYGLYQHADGARYLGDWKDDMQHGSGVETWADGSKY